MTGWLSLSVSVCLSVCLFHCLVTMLTVTYQLVLGTDRLSDQFAHQVSFLQRRELRFPSRVKPQTNSDQPHIVYWMLAVTTPTVREETACSETCGAVDQICRRSHVGCKRRPSSGVSHAKTLTSVWNVSNVFSCLSTDVHWRDWRCTWTALDAQRMRTDTEQVPAVHSVQVLISRSMKLYRSVNFFIDELVSSLMNITIDSSRRHASGRGYSFA